MAHRAEQAFAVEKAAAHDQRRRLFEKRRDGGERFATVLSVTSEAEIMRPRREFT